MADLKEIFIQNIPIIDVRSPSEFKTGHFPSSVNLPILKDEERHLVGIEYKTKGQDAAIALGHSLVSGNVKNERVEAWKNFIHHNPNAKLYCYRGGLRSRISAQWLQEADIQIDVIQGGFKKMRRYLIDETDRLANELKYIILAGKTGVGKTRFLHEPRLKCSFIDLEKIANHKGSAFGAMGHFGYQDAQVTFENKLAIELIRNEKEKLILLEDESKSIGMVAIPDSIFSKMKISPIIVLEKNTDQRVRWIIQEYVIDKTQFFNGDFSKTETFLLDAVARISKNLGSENAKNISNLIIEAFSSVEGQLNDRHYPWVNEMLRVYYDPRYGQKLDLKKPRVIFSGDENQCIDFLKGCSDSSHS